METMSDYHMCAVMTVIGVHRIPFKSPCEQNKGIT